GAYAAGNNLLEANGFRLATRGLARALTGATRAEAPGLAGPDDDIHGWTNSEAGRTTGGHASQPVQRAR
ncbi:hypothetical protein ABTE40_21655, partial [Acinetobacter baumannii]